MEWRSLAVLALILFVAVVAASILTSRSAIEKLVSVGVLPRMFLNFIPVLTIAARAVGLVLMVIGLVLIGINAGILSYTWFSRYGFASLLITLGIILFIMTIRRRPNN
jgi:hypothetical protein